jgi:hypothetical protein
MHPWITALSVNLILASAAIAQSAPVAPHSGAADDDPIRTLVARLDLATYKSTIKGLTRFGDRRQGTERNRAAVDWIEAQLKSYGCANIARLKYTYFPTDAELPSGPPIARNPDAAVGGARYRGIRSHTGVNTDPHLQPDEKLRALNAGTRIGTSRRTYSPRSATRTFAWD